MSLIGVFEQVKIFGIDMTSSASGLNILNQRFARVETNHHIAVGDVNAFFANTCRQETVQMTPAELMDGDKLLFERSMISFSSPITYS